MSLSTQYLPSYDKDYFDFYYYCYALPVVEYMQYVYFCVWIFFNPI